VDAIFEIWAYWLPSSVQFWSSFGSKCGSLFWVQFWFRSSPEPLNDSFSFDFGVRLWTKFGSDFAPKFEPSFKAQIQGGSLSLVRFLVTAVAFHTCSMFHSKRQPVLINLDETSIGLHLSPNPGLVCKRTAKLGLCQERARKRGAITLCAAITHASEVQPYLPQLVLGARAILSRSFLRAAQDRKIVCPLVCC
jgi:hypothetical protein